MWLARAMRREPANQWNAENDKDSAASPCVAVRLRWSHLSDTTEASRFNNPLVKMMVDILLTVKTAVCGNVKKLLWITSWLWYWYLLNNRLHFVLHFRNVLWRKHGSIRNPHSAFAKRRPGWHQYGSLVKPSVIGVRCPTLVQHGNE